MQLRNKTNPHGQKLLLSIACQVKSKRLRAAIKTLANRADPSAFCALPGLVSPYLPTTDIKSVNIIYYHSKENEIWDHGLWFALLPYMLENLNISINLYIIPCKSSKEQMTDYRTMLDYLISNELLGRVKTYVVNQSFSELVSELGTDNISAIINNNPSIDDHNNLDDLNALHHVVDKKVPYIVSDMSPVVLYYKLSMFNQWGLATSNETVRKNAYFVPVSRSVSGTHRFAGYSVNVNTVLSKPQILSPLQRTSLDQYAGALLACLNIGEPLVNIPSVNEDQIIKVFDCFSYDPVKQITTCSHSGDTITVPNSSVPPIPEKGSEMVDNSLWTLWALKAYIAHLNAVSKHKKVAA
jgi:hypothetical protein